MLANLLKSNHLLQRFIKDKSLTMHGIVAIYPADSVENDVETYADKSLV